MHFTLQYVSDFAQISFFIRYLWLAWRNTIYQRCHNICSVASQKLSNKRNYDLSSERLNYPDVELNTLAPCLLFQFFITKFSSFFSVTSLCSVKNPWTLVESTCKHDNTLCWLNSGRQWEVQLIWEDQLSEPVAARCCSTFLILRQTMWRSWRLLCARKAISTGYH
jgi:hypothetical protein